jgi:hypothetical protein
VTTCTMPVVAFIGTLVEMCEAKTALMTASTPLNLTLVVVDRSVPRMVTGAPKSAILTTPRPPNHGGF